MPQIRYAGHCRRHYAIYHCRQPCFTPLPLATPPRRIYTRLTLCIRREVTPAFERYAAADAGATIRLPVAATLCLPAAFAAPLDTDEIAAAATLHLATPLLCRLRRHCFAMPPLLPAPLRQHTAPQRCHVSISCRLIRRRRLPSYIIWLRRHGCRFAARPRRDASLLGMPLSRPCQRQRHCRCHYADYLRLVIGQYLRQKAQASRPLLTHRPPLRHCYAIIYAA